MKQGEAKKEIRTVWAKFISEKNSQDALQFYLHIQKYYPNLLAFRCAGDKYQIIKCWCKEWR
jgi:hypothetical protein